MGRGIYRRMLCSTSPALLYSVDGRLTLNYRPAYGSPAYNPDKYNLVIVWDILMQDYRAVNMSYCNLIAKIPLIGVRSLSDFWTYFNKEIYPKSAAEKKVWMDS